jgi:hypothetical protein
MNQTIILITRISPETILYFYRWKNNEVLLDLSPITILDLSFELESASTELKLFLEPVLLVSSSSRARISSFSEVF